MFAGGISMCVKFLRARHILRALSVLCVGGAGLVFAFDSEAAAVARKSTLPQPSFSVGRGFYDKPLTVELASPLKEASVRCTLDGSEPSSSNGFDYTAPLRITNTTLLRAAAFRKSGRVSAIGTHTYIFLDQVLRQPANPTGVPSGPGAWGGQPSAYQMDGRIVNDPAYRARMKDAFLSLPMVSLVCRNEDMFGPNGLYMNPMERGPEWERACSTEMILPDGTTAFQIDCGLRMQGNMNRVPMKSPKHAFRLLFKSEYGSGKLRYRMFPDSPVTSFDTLVLRADYNNSWIHWDPEQAPRGQRIRDAWMKDTARAMGWTAPHNRYVHLFLNGLYWGVYDFAERPDASFAASYFGGSKENYDVIGSGDVKDGTEEAFVALNSLPNLQRPEHYQKLQSFLDVTNYADYLLLHYYAGNLDWGDAKNCYIIRQREPGTPFQYFVWDGEHVLNEPRDNVVSGSDSGMFPLARQLRKNTEFRRLFAERVQKHCYGNGALSSRACADRWRKRAAEVGRAMIAESARWGYYRRNPPFTRDEDFAHEQRRLLTLYFPQRTSVVLEQLRQAGLHGEGSGK